jgi:site-specific DNA-methyltransferase (adenine-specific)
MKQMTRKIKEGAVTLASPNTTESWINQFLDQIVCGDSFDLIKDIPDNSVNLVITSPPYFQQRDYGAGIGNESSVEEYVERLATLFHECVRVIKEDGSIVFNIGDKYLDSSLLLVPYRFALHVLCHEPVKLVNNITWVKTNPTPRQFKRRLVSSTEPFLHFVKSDKYYYNIDAFLDNLNEGKKKSERNGANVGKKYFELIDRSSLSDEHKRMARAELMQVIQEARTGKIDGFRMKIRGIHSLPFGGQEGGRQIQLRKKGFTIIRIKGEPLKRDVIETAVESIKGCKHPAIYPVYIVQELLKLLTRRGDIVLDPFVGSGSTAEACKRLGRHYIGFDLNPEYCAYARERVNHLTRQYLLTELLP